MTIISTCTSFAWDFDVHGNAPVWYWAQWLMHCHQSFNWSHWTPQLVKYSLRIAPKTASIQAIDSKQMHLTRWRFWWPWQCASTVPSALTYASWSELQFNSERHNWSNICSVSARRPPGSHTNKQKTQQNKCTSLAGHFDGHGDVPVWYQAHWPMHCAWRFNFNQSHWTPQMVKYLLCIAPATNRVPYKQ